MGFGVVGGHLIIMIVIASAGTVLVSNTASTVRDSLEAQSDAVTRVRAAANERFTLASDEWQQGPKRILTTWTNDGSEEIRLSKITLLVAGVLTDTSTVERFQIVEDPTSSIWMPGETLEIWVKDQGNVDLTIIGPYGTAAYRRA